MEEFSLKSIRLKKMKKNQKFRPGNALVSLITQKNFESDQHIKKRLIAIKN